MSITQISCTNFVKDPILRSATIIQTNSHNWEYDFLILRCFSFRVGGSGEATDSIILLLFFFCCLSRWWMWCLCFGVKWIADREKRRCRIITNFLSTFHVLNQRMRVWQKRVASKAAIHYSRGIFGP